MKVLHLGKYYHPVPGGIETQLKYLTLGLKEIGVSQKVIVANTERKTSLEKIDEIHVIRLARKGTIFSTPISFGWQKYINEGEYQIIHLHVPNPLATLYLYLYGFEGKLIVSYHSDIVKQRFLKKVYGPIFSSVLNRAERITIAGPDPRMYDKSIAGVSDKCVQIPYGIDTECWKSTDVVKKGAQKIKGVYKKPIILFVGRLVYYKGLEYLVRAMANLDAVLLIVGMGPEKERLKKIVDLLKLNQKVFFIGYVSNEELPFYYHACNVFCLPSIAKSEAFGIVQLEAMACGKPVVSTEIGTATSFVNRDGETGLVVPPKDEKALSSALKTILSDPILKNRLGENARKHVSDNFNYKLVAKKFFDLYSEII